MKLKHRIICVLIATAAISVYLATKNMRNEKFANHALPKIEVFQRKKHQPNACPIFEDGRGSNANEANAKPQPSVIVDKYTGSSRPIPLSTNRVDFIDWYGRNPASDAVKSAHRNGAKARLTLRVVDSTGQPVEGANVLMKFMFVDKPKNSVVGMTDANGLFTGEKKSTQEIFWAIAKDGYHETTGTHKLVKHETNGSVKDGRWQPWNPEVEVTLKEKRNPMHLKRNYLETIIPAGTQWWFDCERKDWLPPIGKGERGDVSFLFSSTYPGQGSARTNSLVIGFGATGGGLRMRKELFSNLWSDYEAPETGYSPALRFEYERSDKTLFKDTRLGNEEYIVFMSDGQSSVSEKTNNHRFGKIAYLNFGDMNKTNGLGWVKFAYHFNTESNNRNIEDDFAQ